jgi:hypothetical protein
MSYARLIPCLLAAAACSFDDTGVGGGSDGGSSSSGAADSSTGGSGAPQVCTPGERTCEGQDVRVCTAAGDGWMTEPCAADEACNGEFCVPTSEIHVVTEVLAPAQVGLEYAATLEAGGGAGSYSWSVEGAPAGLALDPGGQLGGIPELAGDYVLDVVVEDAEGESASRKLSLAVHSEPLTILTPPDLGVTDEGLEFVRPLIAQGGLQPYGWFLVGGAPPAGVFLDAAGVLTGVPTEPGSFDFTVRVVDVADPPGWDELAFQLDVELRPLSIVGTNVLDLLAFKVVTLPLLAIVPGIPVPYSTQLEADGGLKPYTWTEQPVPDALAFLVTEAGVPDGLTLEADGTLSGAVDNTDQVITVGIPLSPISLTGFFFFAEVADSQDPAETQQALFLIPTVPVG